MLHRTHAVGLALVHAFCGTAYADDINVPGDQPTLAAAVAVAMPGDEIILAPGTYVIASTVSVTSLDNLIIRSASGNADDTVLDGNGLHTGIDINTSDGVVIKGIEFTDFSRALDISRSQASIRECRFTDNHDLNTSSSGVIVYSIVSDLAVESCVFENNSYSGPNSAGGALAAFGGTLTVTGSHFEANSGNFDEMLPNNQGGAILLALGAATGQDFEGVDCTIRRCAFVDNTSESGGAVSGIGATIDIDECVFLRNHATLGGAVFTFGPTLTQGDLPSSVKITNSLFNANSAERLGASINGFGGAVGLGSLAQLEFYNSTVVNNTAEAGTGGIFLFSSAAGFIDNTIFDGNNGAFSGGQLFTNHTLVNDPAVMFADADGSDDIPDNEDDDFRLAAGSAGIDAGGNDVANALTVDLDGNPRFVDDPDTADTGNGTAPIIDIGAYEYQGVPECLADTNHDGVVSPADFSAWVAAFNAQAPECDQNGDGICSPADFSAWVANFNAGCN
ncbi:MAG: hypothetical protein KDA31_00185 [Phycisphaerales bacterium]|nr:hypothetical protein [Phycisphaerales bacterium]MCB9835965.1 hypothetical protein [Phycisphaera sp.]